MAIALPIPRVPPVTKAVLFSNENRDVILSYPLRSDLVPNVVSTEWMIFEDNFNRQNVFGDTDTSLEQPNPRLMTPYAWFSTVSIGCFLSVTRAPPFTMRGSYRPSIADAEKGRQLTRRFQYVRT